MKSQESARTGVSEIRLEKHFSVYEVAEAWGVSADTIRREFRNEPDVLKLGHADQKGAGQRRGRRKYFTLRIPASVVARMQARLGKAA